MRRIFCCCLCLALLLAALCGCGAGDLAFEGFSAPFAAMIEGEWNGVALVAEIAAAAPDAQGARQITMTFYAPSELEGTTLSRLEDGRCYWSVAAWQLPLAADFSALFDLFDSHLEPTRVSLTEQGLTAVETDGARYLFLPDDTLYRIEAAQGFFNVTKMSTLG